LAKLVLQNELDGIIKDIITPILKVRGFRKSSRNYYKEIADFGLCFNIQSSLYNHEQEVKFTFNTGIFIPRVYELYFGRPKPKFPKEYDCFCRKRISQLMNSSDHWYSIKEDTNIDELEDNIYKHIKKFVLPHFELFQSNEDVMKLFYDKAFSKGPNDYALLSGFLIIFGNKVDGEELLREHYNSATNENYRNILTKYADKLGVNIT